MFALPSASRAIAGRMAVSARVPALGTMHVRNLNLHEYQSQNLMKDWGVSVPKSVVVENVDDVLNACKQIGTPKMVIKTQVHAGGRGKGTLSSGLQGGVHVIDSADRAQELAKQMLGYKLKTKQTQGDGVMVNKLMIAEGVDVVAECYFAILLDRATNGPVMVASAEGGMDIEEVAHSRPDAIFKEFIDINHGPTDAQLENLAKGLNFEGDSKTQSKEVMNNLYKMFIGVDSTQVEINPMCKLSDGRVMCVDAKIGFDDNAEFRQADIFAQRDTAEEDPREVEASKYDLNFVGMDGNIGCMVNGAGLAMATMDIIQLHGGKPANFLDLGGGVTESSVGQAFKILTADPKVKGILVNIFGGIVDCGLVARGIIAAANNLGINIPITIRLKGTNEEEAQKLISNCGLKLTMLEDLDEAAINAVKSA
ncbi:succinyl-CoA ligase [GDP-forming] subunit beta, mitochondrial [Sphaeroforma arctica JP610]|uniref:Succinate--CoA ligase [ADP-forming] subunit beta, mitochondrial n=1 Tax=Sphaeroforma arctica JP610 TaxID=667725 RepID=A0A0L0G5W8_9EUKA|nr:succinyl-CoA ligase [GDP-forming] subunit beta, mitochondrial [Sphaeroforma arctica JP610]KNC83608.1 succinyl-CoA ligase [GDP-forming] subunit beta, mitochondrial [Sphaeroforma arctica JP610]|eukprot:XP_014157510.1 succinyl-CoA ligase [GDP-forming] subunit beta, mitochondrial [Sphaeroforma arctica JP610]